MPVAAVRLWNVLNVCPSSPDAGALELVMTVLSLAGPTCPAVPALTLSYLHVPAVPGETNEPFDASIALQSVDAADWSFVLSAALLFSRT